MARFRRNITIYLLILVIKINIVTIHTLVVIIFVEISFLIRYTRFLTRLRLLILVGDCDIFKSLKRQTKNKSITLFIIVITNNHLDKTELNSELI